MRKGDYNECFACGMENPLGLHIEFEVDKDGGARASWTGTKWYAGYPGTVHGGILSTLLDEVMAKAVEGLGMIGVTAKLEVLFRKPVPLDTELSLSGRVQKRRGKRIITSGEIRDNQKQLLTEGKALFIILDMD